MRKLIIAFVLMIPTVSFACEHVPFSQETETTYCKEYAVDVDGAAYLRHSEKNLEKNVARQPMPNITGYYHSGYDKGHLIQNILFRYSVEANKASNNERNLRPQTAGFNRGIWRKLENYEGKLLKKHPHLITIVGFTQVRTIGGLRVPQYYYRIMLDPDTLESAAYVLKNKAATVLPSAVSIDFIESMTGRDFLRDLADDVENVIEAREADTLR